MMYGNKLAAAIKVNGKVLREFKDTVYIPFGAEYTILVKNLETKRAIVNIFIDGENVVRCTPHIGYLHTGIEKQCETRTWAQVVPLTDVTEATCVGITAAA